MQKKFRTTAAVKSSFICNACSYLLVFFQAFSIRQSESELLLGFLPGHSNIAVVFSYSSYTIFSCLGLRLILFVFI
jgi:hypothetical protein